MSTPEWPSPEQQRPLPLPRVDELPVAEQGYDREAVREAFDSFYRHAAQLDATLRTLEAVEVFQRTASELRAELRTVRAAGWTVSSYQRGSGYGGARASAREWSLPPAFPRVAAEALFLIVIGVIVGIAGWSRIAIVLVMALALAIVWLVEWVASRERVIPQASATPISPPRLDEPEEPAELAAGEAAGWSAFSEQPEEGPEAMTMLSAEPAQPVAESDEREEEPEPEPEPEVPVLVVPVVPVVQPGVAPPAPAPVAPSPDEPAAEAVPVALEDPVPVDRPPDEDPVPVDEPPDEDPVPVDEPAEEDELVTADQEAVALAEDTPELEPPAVEEPPAELVDEPVRRRFRLWRRGPAVAEEPAVPVEAEPELAPEPVEGFVAEVDDAEPVPVDPWEREPELPIADIEPEAGHEPLVAAEVEPEQPRSRWFRRRRDAVAEPVAEPEPEAPVEAEAEAEAPEPELAPELLEAIAEPEEPEPLELEEEEPEEEEEEEEPEEEEPEARELPVELVAEQAEAALVRSRARRRPARRARRR